MQCRTHSFFSSGLPFLARLYNTQIKKLQNVGMRHPSESVNMSYRQCEQQAIVILQLFVVLLLYAVFRN